MNRMKNTRINWLLIATAIGVATVNAEDRDGTVASHSRGLHGYIGFGTEKLPSKESYSAGMGFYSAVWPLVDEPLADFQIGLPAHGFNRQLRQ